jgi:hypothetical protein
VEVSIVSLQPSKMPNFSSALTRGARFCSLMIWLEKDIVIHAAVRRPPWRRPGSERRARRARAPVLYKAVQRVTSSSLLAGKKFVFDMRA